MTFSRMPRRGSPCTKLISIFLILSFVSSNIVFAAPSEAPSKVQAQQIITTDPNNIVIPREFGLVKTKFTGKEPKLIIHIQDAHCNYEAQSNIVKILENLNKNYSVSLISVEGADGVIDTSWFKAFPDDEVRKEVADYFMKKGEITGPEFLSITSDYNIKLFGAETRSFYIDNLNAFTASYPLKAETEKYLNGLKRALNKLKGFIYSDDLKLMDAKAVDYESKKLPFNDYVKFLQSEAERAKINLRAYDNLFKLVNVLVYEKKIDFNVTDKERSVLIDELSKLIPKETLTELVNKSLEFKAGKITSADYYTYLRALSVKNDIDMGKTYPNLYNYIIYNSVYSKIENEKLFNDIKKVEIDIKEKLFTSDDQRTLEKLSRHIEILIGLVNIKLLNDDFEYFEKNKAEFAHEIFADFIRKKTVQYALAYELDDPNEAVSKSLPKLEDFYSIAIKRDKTLVDNTLGQMKKDKAEIAVLVTGGFHSEGISKLLEKQGVSYMVICPSITKDVPTPYIQILTNQRTPLEDILVKPAHAAENQVSQAAVDTLAPPLRSELATMTDTELAEFLSEVNISAPLKDDIKSLKDEWYSKAMELYLVHMRRDVGGVSASTTIIVDNIMDSLKSRLNELNITPLERNKIKGSIERAINNTKTLKKRMEEAARVEAARKGAAIAGNTPGTPGINATSSSPAASYTPKNVDVTRAFDAVIASCFVPKRINTRQTSFIDYDHVVKGFKFVRMEGLLDKLEEAGLPLEIHPGRGPKHELLQAHISAYFYDNLTEEERATVARHEAAHIHIANGKQLGKDSIIYRKYRAALNANPNLNEEVFVDSLAGCDTTNIRTKLARLLDIRKAAKAAVNKAETASKTIRIEDLEAIVAMDETFMKGDAYVAGVLKSLLTAREGIDPRERAYVSDYLSHRAQLDAIGEIRDIPRREGAGYGAYIFVSSTQVNADYWQKRFMAGRGSVLPKGAVVISVSEENWKNPKGASNGFGTFNGWIQAEKAYKKLYPHLQKNKSLMDICKENGVIMMHMAGKATRMQTIAMDNKSAVKLPGQVLIDGKWESITVGEAVIMNFGLNVRPGRLTLAWGDQNNIPSTDISSPNTHLAEIFGVSVPIEGHKAFLPQKGLLDPTGRGKDIRQREKLPIEIIENTAERLGRKDADMSLGFNSFKWELLEAALAEFKPELENEGRSENEHGRPTNLMTSLNIDSELWGPFTSSETDYVEFMKGKGPASVSASDWETQIRRHWAKVRKIFAHANDLSGGRYKTFDETGIGVMQGISYGTMDVSSEWWDWGLIDLYFNNFMLLLRSPKDHKEAWQTERIRRFFGLPTPDQWKATSQLGTTTVENSIVLGSNIKEGRIINSVIIGTTADFLDVENSIVINGVIHKLIAKGHNVITDFVANPGETIVMEKDEILACHYLPVGGQLRMFENFNNDIGKDYESAITVGAHPQNPMSAKDASDKLKGVNVPDRENAKRLASISYTTPVNVQTITRNQRYEHNIRNFPQGPFGTSGIRSTMEFLNRIQCYTIAQGILSFFTDADGSTSQDTIIMSADRRPPSENQILPDFIMGAISMDRKVSYAKDADGHGVPTPAVSYYGLYNEAGPNATAMVTASHNPFDEFPYAQGGKLGQWDGAKPTVRSREVLKEHERRILAHVREMREIEYRLSSDETLFDETGSIKKDLSASQAELIAAAASIMRDLSDINLKAVEMYEARYMDAFTNADGTVCFNGEHIGFWQHTAVGRELVPRVMERLGLKVHRKGLTDIWDMAVDTEDIKPNVAAKAKELARETKKEAKDQGSRSIAFATVDGDSDRPGIFTEDGEFIYGDKLDYLACEYLHSQNPDRDMYVVVTASVSEAVIRKIESMSTETHNVRVIKVPIGSPYVVKKMEDISAENRNAIVVGFERNGGFLAQTDIPLKNGKVLRALPTRDALLPLLCALTIAAKEKRTISELVAERFSAEFESYSWSGLVDNATNETEYAAKWCEKYTAPLGQAIMRDFTPPKSANAMEIIFDGDTVSYTTFAGTTVTATPALVDTMKDIRTRLKKYFHDGLVPANIVRINYIDGVRIYFANNEIIHMRPSGNAPQWRIYAEAATLARTKDLIETRLVAYPAIIEDFVAKSEKMKREKRFVPKSINEIMDLLGVTGYGTLNTFDLNFGDRRQHRVEESYIFTENSLILRSLRIYDIGTDKEKTVDRQIKYTPKDRTVEITETIKNLSGPERVTVKVSATGDEAYIDIGKAIDRNVPMVLKKAPFGLEYPVGLVEVGQPFPIMDDSLMALLEQQGVSFLHLFDIMPTSIISAEPLLWGEGGNFKFDSISEEEAEPVDMSENIQEGINAADGQRITPGYYGVVPAPDTNQTTLQPQARSVQHLDMFANPTIESLSMAVSRANAGIQIFADPKTSVAARGEIKTYYHKLANLALQTEDIEQSQGLQTIALQALAIITMIDQKVPGAEKLRLTYKPGYMVKAKDNKGNERSPSYLSYPSVIDAGIEVSETENDLTKLHWRGIEGVSKLGPNGANIIPEASYAENQTELGKLVMYGMLHLGKFHTTVFTNNTLPRSIQHASTGKGHFQGNSLDVKYVVSGQMLQMLDIYDEAGNKVKTLAHLVKEGEWTIAIPGAVDYIIPLTDTVIFNDINIPLPEISGEKMRKAQEIVAANLKEIGEAANKSGQAGYGVIEYQGKPALVKIDENAREIEWFVGTVPNPLVISGDNTLFELSQKLMAQNTVAEALLPQLKWNTEKPMGAPVIITAADVTRAGEAAKIAESGMAIISRPTDAPVLKEYPWGGTGLSGFLGWVKKKIAELWLNSTQGDGLSKIPGAQAGATLADTIAANPEKMLGKGRTVKSIFNKILGKDETQPQIVHMGFNEKIVGNKEAFVNLTIKEREFATTLKDKLAAALKTKPQFEQYAAAYERWVNKQIDSKWTLRESPELPEFMSGFDKDIFEDTRKTREELVSYLNEIRLAPGQVIISPVGYIHSIVGSHQTHPLDVEAKNEAWYIMSDGKGGLLYFEPQQTSNTTYSPFDFPTPIVWKQGAEGEGGVAMRKDFLNDKKELANLGLLIGDGESMPASEADVLRLIADKTIKFESSTPEDFIVNSSIRDMTGEHSDAVNGAKVESLISGSYPVMGNPPFTLERITLPGEGASKPASISVNPVKDSFYELTVTKGEVTVAVNGKEETLTAGSTVFVPASYGNPIAMTSNGEAEVLRTYPPSESGKAIRPMLASEIIAVENKETGHIKDLTGTLVEIGQLRAAGKLKGLDDGVIINAFDTRVEDTTGAIQLSQKLIDQSMGGTIINIRGTGKALLDGIEEAIEANKGRVRAVVTTTPDQATAAEAMRFGSVVNVEQIIDGKPRYMPVPKLHDLALRIAIAEMLYKNKSTGQYSEEGARWVYQCLDKVALAPDNKPFTVSDVMELLKRGFFRILPRIVPVDLAAAREAYIAAQAALKSL